MSVSKRNLFLPLHLWLGLTVGLVLIVMAFSGALLAFRQQLEPRLHPNLFFVPAIPGTLPPSDLIARARAAYPDRELESVRYFSDPTAPFLVYFKDRVYVHLDPHTGKVLGIRKRYGESFGWIEGLHKFLQLKPTFGEAVTGYASLAFTLIISSGFVLWWPATRRALKASLTLNRRLTGRPWNLNLHKVLGVYAGLILLVSCLTGAPISLDWAKRALYPLTNSAKVSPPPSGAIQPFLGFDAVARTMASVFPHAHEIYMPLPVDGLVRAYVIEAGANHPNARSYVWIDPGSAEVLKLLPYKQAPTGFRLYYWMLSLHTGEIGGPGMQAVLLLGALAALALAYTGTASFLKRKFGRKAGTTAIPDGSAARPSIVLRSEKLT